MQQLFSQHLAQVQQHIQAVLTQYKLDGIWIYAGQASRYFLDDQSVPFKINPHFNYIFPFPQAENSWLFLDGKNKPKVYFYAPDDYWQNTIQPPLNAFFSNEFDWYIFTENEQFKSGLKNIQHCAFIGENSAYAKSLGFCHINPQGLLNVLHFARSIKSEFEIACLRQAQFSALAGHQAAKKAFFDGKSEFEINLAYLAATKQSDLNVPYGNIVALNQHGAILHYTALETAYPKERHSFLIDAGSSFHGYASDLTRTYAADPRSEFAQLIAKMNELKTACIANLRVGESYLAHHIQMHRWISNLLQEADLVRLPAEQIFEEGISRTFFPHGLGHLLGLQVHDVAGHQQNALGECELPPEIYSSLRCTRKLQEGMVLTIEPGLYFIDSLLSRHQNSPHFNWAKIDMLRACGGIRTEDNVVIRSTGAENLTANAENRSLHELQAGAFSEIFANNEEQ